MLTLSLLLKVFGSLKLSSAVFLWSRGEEITNIFHIYTGVHIVCVFVHIYIVKSIYTRLKKLMKTVIIILFLCKNDVKSGGGGGVRVGCSLPVPSAEKNDFELHDLLYSLWKYYLCYYKCRLFGKGQILTSLWILAGSPSSREMYSHKSAKFVSFKVLEFFVVSFPGSF